MRENHLRVAAAIIYDKKGEKILLSQRKKEQDFSGLWEFPGGKIEANESPLEALIREIKEELDLTILKEGCQQALNFHYQYPDKSIEFFFFDLWQFEGTPKGNENQIIEWVPLNKIAERQFPAANVKVVEYLLAQRLDQ